MMMVVIMAMTVVVTLRMLLRVEVVLVCRCVVIIIVHNLAVVCQGRLGHGGSGSVVEAGLTGKSSSGRVGIERRSGRHVGQLAVGEGTGHGHEVRRRGCLGVDVLVLTSSSGGCGRGGSVGHESFAVVVGLLGLLTVLAFGEEEVGAGRHKGVFRQVEEGAGDRRSGVVAENLKLVMVLLLL